MKNKKLITAAILAVLCLSITMFMVIPTRSDSNIGEYDPWADLDDNGSIDIFDAIHFAGHFGTTGTPINKTDLLLQLLNRLDQLNTTVIEQQNIINSLNNTVVYLNQTVVELNGTRGLGPPDYDSGWVSLTTYANWFSHNLQTTRVFIYVMGQGSDGTIHQIAYGGDVGGGGNNGVFWSALDSTKVAICRVTGDVVWVQARVIMWKIP